MGIAKKAVILGCLFGAQALVVGWLGDSGARPYETTSVIRDLHVAGWTDVDIPDPTGLLDQLQADRSIFKEFRGPAGEQVMLYVGYYESIQQAKMSHAPQVCFTGQGWLPETTRTATVPFGRRAFRVNEMIVTKGDRQDLVYFWYESPDRALAQLFLLKLDMLKNVLLSGDPSRGRNAFIRVSTPADDGLEAGRRRLQAFLGLVSPGLRGTLFGEQAVREAAAQDSRSS